MMHPYSKTISLGAALCLFLGDLALLFLFTLAGRGEHAMEFSLLATLITTIPFMLGWIIAAIFLGMAPYQGYAVSNLRNAVKWAVITSAAAVPIGLILRSWMYQKELFNIFFVLAFALIMVFMVIWRVIFTLLRNNMSRQS